MEVSRRRNASGLEGGLPHPVEVAAAGDAARWPDKEPAIGTGLGVLGKVRGDVIV